LLNSIEVHSFGGALDPLVASNVVIKERRLVGLGQLRGAVLVDGRTSVLPQVDLHSRRRAVGSLWWGSHGVCDERRV